MQKTQKQGSDLEYVLLVSGESENKAYWAYIVIDVEKYFSLIEDSKNQEIDLENYGKIIASGEGEPSENKKIEIEGKYKVSHSLEELTKDLLGDLAP